MRFHTKPKLPEALKTTAHAEAHLFLEEVTGVKAVVIATVDGFDVAHASIGGPDPARVAATASSISAIGSVVSHESQLGRSRCVMVDTESGFAVMHSVRRRDGDLVVSVIADATAVLGRVNHRAGQMAHKLAAV